MKREMSDDTQAKLLYAAVGAALDCGATPNQIKKLFRQKNIEFVIDVIGKQNAAAEIGKAKEKA